MAKLPRARRAEGGRGRQRELGGIEAERRYIDPSVVLFSCATRRYGHIRIICIMQEADGVNVQEHCVQDLKLWGQQIE